jgi:hypothetical protein
MKQILALALLLSVFSTAFAQSPTDGLMMPKGSLCNLISYSKSNWTNYWEGETKRSNTNLGTFASQSVMLMGALGLTDKLNVMAALPYIKTSASASYLAGQSGFQDVSAWLKYRIVEKKSNFGDLKVFATLGGSVPTTNYVADFLPFSIGLHTKTASGRLIVNYNKNGFYINAQGGATLRSKVQIDRNSFIFNNKLYESDLMPVPNAADGSLTLGYLHKSFQTAVSIDKFGCLTGDDIRYNDAPILTNNMQATSINWFGRVNLGHLSLMASVGKVLNGRNVGQATSFGGSVLYWFQVFNKNKEIAK